MKKLILFIFGLTFFCITSATYAREYTFGSFKVTTTDRSATVLITSSATYSQHYFVSIWSTNDRSDPANKLGEKEVVFNTPPPRTTSFVVNNLGSDTTYYLFYENAGSTSGASYYTFKTDPITPYLCTSCKLEASINNNSITAKFSGADALLRGKVKLLMRKDDFVAGKPLCTGIGEPFDCSNQPTKEVELGGTVKWTIPTDSLLGRTAYNLRVEAESPITIGSYYISDVKKITTGDENVRSTWPLTYNPDDTKASIGGKIENQNPGDFTLKLQYSTKQFSENGQSLPAEAREVSTVASNDGTYTFQLINLSPNTLYFVKQIIKADSRGALEIKVNNTGFNSTTGYKAEGSKEQLDDIKKRSYTLLAPFSEKLQVVLDPDLCREFVAQKKRPEGSCDNQISDFINLMLTVLIGIAAVVLVIELIVEGYRYMVTDTPFAKISAKSRFFEALLGLLLALSAYLILNTINPKLVSNDLNINNVNISVITDFDVSGPLTGSFDGKAIKVNFNKEAYPAAKLASEKTGVSTALILAIFSQETGSGSNIGKCRWTDAAANMYPADKPAFQTITTELGKNTNETALSCALKNSDGTFNGHGGAIGYTQVLPTTWLNQRLEAKDYLGHMPSPWNVGDALMVTAIYLKKNGGTSNEREAACKYYAGPGNSCSTNSGIGRYGDQVMGKKLSLEKQIEDSIKKGEIK